MAKRAKKEEPKKGAAWLVTFSDLVTLLLTFFVLLLSMASMDRNVLTKINLFTRDVAMSFPRAAGRIPQRIRFITDLLDNPWDILEKPDRIKDLLFPDDILPKDISTSTLEENMKVLVKPEGVALVLTDKLLFPPGGYALTPAARVLLDQVAQVLAYMTVDVNIAGFSDTEATGMDPYALSDLRALAVLEFFMGQGLGQSRFSVSGYGPNLPVADNDTSLGRAQNRRVEILVKTTPQIGGYL